MKGHMRERSGGWELRVFAGRDSVTGRKRYLTRTVRGGKREAQRALAALIVEAGENGAPRRGTLVELPEEWFAHAEPDFSPKTAAETRRILDRTVIPRLGDRRVDKLRPSDLDALYGELRTTGGWAGRSLAPATVRRIHGIIHRALGQGVRWGWVAKNPAAQASPPRVPPPRIEPPSPADVAKLIELPAVASRRRDPRLRKAPRSGGPARRPASRPAALCRHSIARVRGRRQNRGWPTWPSQRRNHPQRLLALLDGA
jgi:integrase